MARVHAPKAEDYLPHQEGTHRGEIAEVREPKVYPTNTPFEDRPKVMVKIVSTTAMLAEGPKAGQPAIITDFWNVSSHKQSIMYQRITALLGNRLNNDEELDWDTEELVGMNVGYVVEHKIGSNGSTYANIMNMWPLDAVPAVGNGSAPPASGTAPPPANGVATGESKSYARDLLKELEAAEKMGANTLTAYRAWLDNDVRADDLDPLVLRWEQEVNKVREAKQPVGAPPPPVVDDDLPF